MGLLDTKVQQSGLAPAPPVSGEDVLSTSTLEDPLERPSETSVAPGPGLGAFVAAGPPAPGDDNISDVLYEAMRGLGTDEDAIFDRLERAAPAELLAVLSDPELMAELRSELTHSELKRLYELLNVPLADKLRLAIEGLGTDEDYLRSALNDATAEELLEVIEDPALMAAIQSDLSGDELLEIAESLGIPLDARARHAIEGLGTDESYLMHAFGSAPIAELRTVVGDAALMVLIEGDLSGGERDEFYGLVARRLLAEGGTDDEFRAFVAKLDGAVRLRIFEAALAGGGPVELIRSCLDDLIQQSANSTIVIKAFQLYWSVITDEVDGASSWKIDVVKAVHVALLALPTDDTRAGVWQRLVLTGDPDLTNRAAWNPNTGAILIGDNLGVGGTASIGQGDPEGARSVDYIAHTVRHEIGHAVDSDIGAADYYALGGWWTGKTFADWTSAMSSPWSTNDGSTISDADKADIGKAVEAALAKKSKDLLGTVKPTHPLAEHWGKEVPAIKAADNALTGGERFYDTPEDIHSDNGRRFSVSMWYGEFMYHNDDVVSDRVSNYSLFAPAEFFADAYSVFYEEAGDPAVTEEQYGRLIRKSAWRDWIRSNVHERGAAPAASGTGTATPGSSGVGRASGNSGS